MILHSVWYSADKPSMTTLLQPLIDDVNSRYLQGECSGLPRKLLVGPILNCYYVVHISSSKLLKSDYV